jgi:diacylglycerol kinase family enzyme
MRKALLLYNPAAGRRPIKSFVPSVVSPLQAAGWRVELAETLSGSHATSVARQAAAEKFDAVFAIGGDGTIGQVANGLVNTDTALRAVNLSAQSIAMLLRAQAFTGANAAQLEKDLAEIEAKIEAQVPTPGET